jgi:hypothetical protein
MLGVEAVRNRRGRWWERFEAGLSMFIFLLLFVLLFMLSFMLSVARDRTRLVLKRRKAHFIRVEQVPVQADEMIP